MKKDPMSLRNLIPNYEGRISSQIQALNLALEAFHQEMDTSLDVILMRSLNNLKYVLMEYAKLLDQILVVKGVLSQDQSRRRQLSDLVSMAQTSIQFHGGKDAVAAAKFLTDMQNRYLSSVEEKVYTSWIKRVRNEYVALESFIEDN